MSNKVTNIYIDTTGFSDEAKYRVNKALDIIVEYNEMENAYPSRVAEFKSHLVTHFDHNGIWCRTFNASPSLDGKRQVGLWELESIAFRCKQEEKEEPLPTRNIYIDARKLDQEQRRNAFAAITALRDVDETGWLPNRLAHAGRDTDYILFDIFAIGSDGVRHFYSKEYSQGVEDRLLGVKELTYDQLMSLIR